MMTTSEQLRAWRTARRWTQKQTANALDYSLRAYAEHEKPDKAVPKWLALAIGGLDDRTVARSLHGTTMGDLSDIERVKDAEHELRRAATDAALADWARRWGGCALERLHHVADEEFANEDDLEGAEEECTRLETKNAEIRVAAETLIKVCDDIPDHTPAFDNAIAALENAL